MRLRNAAAAAVLACGSAAGLAVAMFPAAAAVHPDVTRVAVTVVTFDRAGHRVSTPVQLQNLKTGTIYNLTSGKASLIPDGSYNVGAQIVTANPQSVTFADRPLTVSRAGSVTLDARNGRLVRFTVNDPHATAESVSLAAASPATGLQFAGGAAATPVYVIPGKLPAGWDFYAMEDLSSVTAARSPVEYGLIRVVTIGIPGVPAWSSSVSKLATVHVTVRRLNPGDNVGVNFTPEVSVASNPFFPLWQGMASYFGATPFTVQFRLTPGYSWQQLGSYGEDLLNNLPVWGAHQYYETFAAAVFSPNWAAENAVVADGNKLVFGTPQGEWLLVDPAVARVPDSNSSGVPAAETAALYQAGKLIGTSNGTWGTVTIPAAAKWYRELVVARPQAGGVMSGRVTLDYTFPAAAQPDQGVYSPDYIVPVIKPAGLNADNAARPGTKTTVPITLSYGVADHSVGVRGVQVWASANGGKTWTALRVTRSGGTWTVTVTNPNKAGWVSLRVRAALSNGVTTVVTVINAYAVS